MSNYYAATRNDLVEEDDEKIVTAFGTIEELEAHLERTPEEERLSEERALIVAERSGFIYIGLGADVPDCVTENIHWDYWGTDETVSGPLSLFHLCVNM